MGARQGRDALRNQDARVGKWDTIEMESSGNED